MGGRKRDENKPRQKKSCKFHKSSSEGTAKNVTGERAWKAIGERLQEPCYLSRDDHDRKIRSRKQRTDIGKHYFVNRTIRLWNNLPAEALVTFLQTICL
jgi:hypothetical protein